MTEAEKQARHAVGHTLNRKIWVMDGSTIEKQGDRVIIKVNRNIDDLESGENFKSTLMSVYQKGEKNIVINFDGAQIINSHCIGKLLMFYKRLKPIGGAIYVTPLKGEIKHIFSSLMLNSIIPEVQVS